MKKILGIFILLFMFSSCSNKNKIDGPSAEIVNIPTRKALLVGNNNYPGAPLSGCINDIMDVSNELINHYGFNPHSEILILTNSDTKTILGGLEWLVKDTKPGDYRLFHFSGHGVEYAGIDVGTQPFGINQAICPIDFDWSPMHMVQDVQLVKIFRELPNGVIFNWISDSCHSGDLSRSTLKKDVKSKTYPIVPRTVQTQLTRAKKHSRGFVNNELDVGFISGCKYNQTSADTYDASGKARGALTWYFLDELKKDRNRPLQTVIKVVRENLLRDGYTQEPQAEGARKNKPFLIK
jgi:hypothetical protein